MENKKLKYDKYRDMNKDYLIYFKLKDGQYRIYWEETKVIETVSKLPRDIGKFIMLKVDDNTATDEDLKDYAKKFMQWCYELRYEKGFNFKYSEWHSDYTAITSYFNRCCNYKTHEPITPLEYKWFERCANYGIQYLRENDYTKTGYGYDFKNQYALVLNSSNKIPTAPGKEITLKELPKLSKDLQHGFYRVKITCDNENFRKMFAFSTHHTYLHYSLQFAMKCVEKYDVKIELIEEENNAYVYANYNLMKLEFITDRWFTELTTLRKKYPQNRLIKHLLSSVWGHLNASNIKHCNLQEMKELKSVGVTMDDEYMIMKYHENDYEQYWEIMDTNRPYKYNIRLKPWITALARNMTGNIVLENPGRVIRVHTDGIVFSKEMEFDNENLIPEEKTTGKIHWKNNNCYHNITTGYKTKGYSS